MTPAAARSRPILAAEPVWISPLHAASWKSFSEFFAVVEPPLSFFGFVGEFGNFEFVGHSVQSPFDGAVEIDQALGGWERRDDANTRFAESGDDDQKATLVGAADTGDAVFAIHSLGVNVERIIVDDLFSLCRRDLMTSDAIAVGIVPVKSQIGRTC